MGFITLQLGYLLVRLELLHTYYAFGLFHGRWIESSPLQSIDDLGDLPLALQLAGLPGGVPELVVNNGSDNAQYAQQEGEYAAEEHENNHEHQVGRSVPVVLAVVVVAEVDSQSIHCQNCIS